MSGLLINYNQAAVSSYNNLDSTNTALTSIVGHLSSGLAIQTAADNPAGYVVGQYLQAQANGYTQAISNTQDAVSVLQTAQGALGQEATILQTMATLANQAANGGTQSAGTLAAAQSEFVSLQNELDQIAQSTSYGSTSLLNGSYSNETFQVGPYNSASNQISISIADSSASSLGVGSLGTTAISIGTVAGAEAAMTAVAAAISTVAGQASGVGATQNQVTSLAANLMTAQQNIQSAHANLVDINVASATTTFTTLQILEQAGVAILSQAEQLPSLAQKLM
jgi:flagellin